MRSAFLVRLSALLHAAGLVTAAVTPVRPDNALEARNNWGGGDDGYNGHGHDDDDRKHGGKHDGKHGGKHGCKRWGGHGHGGYDDGYGNDGHHGGHDGHGGHDHDGDDGHGGHHDDDCDSDDDDDDGNGGKDTDDIVKWVLDNPTVITDLRLPDTVNNHTIIDLVDSGTVPTINFTAPLLNDTLPALVNGSTPATGFGGVTADGLNATHRPPQGTNENSPVFTRTVAFSLSPNLTDNTDYRGRMVAIGTQPSVPLPLPDPNKRCEYEYENVLGGNGTTSRGALWALEGYVDLVAADVMQGGIGDCGMGAAVMALADGGWTRYLKAMFIKRFDVPNAGDRTIAAVFKKDGGTQIVLIDDQLPVLQNVNPNCWPYPGYQPVNDAAEPGPDGRYPPTPIFFMPLFEKAFAKFLDANTDWRAAPAGSTGYAGLEGVQPHYVLAAITGGTPKAVWRTRTGFDGPILAALITCMRGVAPCVIGTTNAKTLEGLGTLDQFSSIWLNPAGDEAVPKGYTSGTTSGLLAPDAPKSEHTYTVIDFDQLIKTPDGDRSTVVTMVGNHAYAFEWQRSTHLPLTNLFDARMRVLNPWGSNPNSWPGGGGGGGGAFDNPAEVTHSLRSFAQTVTGVYTVENMPAI